MSISDGLDPHIFCRKMEKTRFLTEELDGRVFFSHQSRHYSFVNNMIKVLLPIRTLNWHVNNYVCRQGKGINRRNESSNNNIETAAFGFVEGIPSHY